MEGWRAATHTGLDLWQWDSGMYPKWFKAKTIAFYRFDTMISSHAQEAAQDASKKTSNRK